MIEIDSVSNKKAIKIAEMIHEKVGNFEIKHKTKFIIFGLFLLLIVINVGSFWLYENVFFRTVYISNEAAEADGYNTGDDEAGELADISDCNVIGISLNGELDTYSGRGGESVLDENTDVTTSDDVNADIDLANESENIKAIFVEVDSPGGIPLAGEEIADAIKKATKPVIAVIRQQGASAAYWAISPADKIFASRNSDIGSIGITMSYIDNVKQNQKDGLEYINLSSGKYKDTGSPDRALTDDEKELLMRDLKISHENFIEAVAENRNLAIDKVRSFADGSTVLGAKAKELGLIDEIGLELDAIKYIEDKIGDTADICW